MYNKSLNNRLTFAIVYGMFLVLVLSDWVQQSIGLFLPVGFRHVILLMGFIILFIATKDKSHEFNTKQLISLGLITLLCILMIISLPVRIFNFFLGGFFTFLFFGVFYLSKTIKINIRVIHTTIKSIVLTLLILGIIPFCQAIIKLESMRWYPGFFRELGALGGCMNIGVILSLYLLVKERKKIYLVIALVFSIIIFATILKKSILDLVIIWILFFWMFRNQLNLKKLHRYAILTCIATVPFLLQELITNINENVTYFDNVGADGHVRLVMYLKGASIANDFFPLGSGLGTFGTPASVFGTYSEIYHTYGISSIETLAPFRVMNGFKHTLFDTYWPHILAELGYLGLILFLYLWISPILLSRRKLKFHGNIINRKLANFVAISTITFISLDGLTLFNPEIPLFIFFSHGLTSLITNSQM